MKPEPKPFVVEFKNRRRHPRKETSIWGRIDLKAAGAEVAAELKAEETSPFAAPLPETTISSSTELSS
jgi:hypothetical protein